MELDEINPELYHDQSSRDIEKKMNNLIRRMSEKISSNSKGFDNSKEEESRLPDLKIPRFRGDYSEWNNFKDLFNYLISKRTKMSNISKMKYLKTHLDGEPAKLINSYLLSGNNYEAALNALDKRYNNKRLLFSIHIDKMMKPFGGTVTSDTIKEMYDNIKEGRICHIQYGN